MAVPESLSFRRGSVWIPGNLARVCGVMLQGLHSRAASHAVALQPLGQVINPSHLFVFGQPRASRNSIALTSGNCLMDIPCLYLFTGT